MPKLFTIYFRKSTSGFQVLAKIERRAPLGDHHGFLNCGREMTAESALAYAKRYIAYRNQFEYEFYIDESVLNGEGG